MSEDALTLGARLKEEELQQSATRIRLAIEYGSLLGGASGTGVKREDRERIAAALYSARYDGRAYDEVPAADEVLDSFCYHFFGCSFAEVLQAWDRELS